jgi:hypothetical protein
MLESEKLKAVVGSSCRWVRRLQQSSKPASNCKLKQAKAVSVRLSVIRFPNDPLNIGISKKPLLAAT